MQAFGEILCIQVAVKNPQPSVCILKWYGLKLSLSEKLDQRIGYSLDGKWYLQNWNVKVNG